MNFIDFQIRAWQLDEGYVQVMVHNSPVGDMRKPVTVSVKPNQFDTIHQTVKNAWEGRPGTRQRIIEAGRQLAEVILPEPVHALLRDSLQCISPDNDGLRLRLCLDESLVGLPWEFLYEPGFLAQESLDGFFVLRLRPRISLVREVPRTSHGSQPSLEEQRMVFVGLADHREDVSSAFEPRRIKAQYQLLVKALGDPVKEFLSVEYFTAHNQIEQALSEPAAIFHYVGHTDMVNDQGSLVLEMEKRDGETTIVRMRSEQLGTLLQGAGTRLATFCACNSGQWAFVEPLIRAGLPAIIGAHDVITTTGALPFFETLYSSLAIGLSLDEAVTEARLRLFLDPKILRGESCEWGAYMVYMPTAEPILLPRPASPIVRERQHVAQNTRRQTERAAEYEKEKLYVPPSKYIDLEVSINSCREIVVGTASVGKMNPEWPTTEIKDDMARIVAKEGLCEAFFQEFGTKLFGAFFTPELKDVYIERRTQARERDDHILRLSVNFHPQELARIPWEYLYDPQKGLFLASSREMAFSRGIPTTTTPAPFAVEGQLRVLVAISNPEDLKEKGFDPLNVEEERQAIRDALDPCSDIELDFLDKPSFTNLRRKLDHFRPHIFHFVGHGTWRDNFPQLVMATDENRMDYISASQLRSVMHALDELRVVILSACHSGEVREGSSLVGIAPVLIDQCGIPAVLAMQYSVSIPVVRRFALQLYNALVDGHPVDHAVNCARMDLYGNENRRDFGTPVLYTLTPHIFAR